MTQTDKISGQTRHECIEIARLGCFLFAASRVVHKLLEDAFELIEVSLGGIDKIVLRAARQRHGHR